MAINSKGGKEFTKMQSSYSKIEKSFIVNSLANFELDSHEPSDEKDSKNFKTLLGSIKNEDEEMEIPDKSDIYKLNEIHSLSKINKFDSLRNSKEFQGSALSKEESFSKRNIFSEMCATPIEREKDSSIDNYLHISTPKIMKNESSLIIKSGNYINDFEINNEYPNINADFTKRIININTLINNNTNANKTRKGNSVIMSQIKKEGFDLTEFEKRPPETVKLVKSISYIYNKINMIPKDISKYINLQELKLDHNKISEIPSCIKELVHLNIFTISFNLLEKIPDEISVLCNLKILILNDNLIKEIPKSVCNLPLIALYFHENKITHIPTSLYKLTTLAEISFDWLFYIPPYCLKIIKEYDGSKTIEKLFNLCKVLESKSEICDFTVVLTYFHENNMTNLINKPIFANGRTFIHRSAINGNLEVLNVLLKNNCNINQEDESGCTALLLSLKANTFDISLRLLQFENCEMNKSSPKYGNPLLISLSKKKYDIAEKILQRKEVNLDCVDAEGNNPLHIIFGHFLEHNKQLESICNLLIERSCQVNQKNYSKLAPLHYAIKKGKKAAILFALEYNKRSNIFNLNERCGKYDWTILHYSVIYSEIEILKKILLSKVDIFAVDKYGKTARNLSLIGSLQYKTILKEENLQRANLFRTRLNGKSKNLLINKRIRLNFFLEKRIKINLSNLQDKGHPDQAMLDIN